MGQAAVNIDPQRAMDYASKVARARAQTN